MLNWIKKTVADILFTTSVTGFLDQRNNGSMRIFFKKNFNCNYSQVCLLFVSSLCVGILSKMNQSFEDFFLLDSHSQDWSDRGSSQGTSIILGFSCIDAIVE